jgi:chemotaxis methyl-accepting protein methylase
METKFTEWVAEALAGLVPSRGERRLDRVASGTGEKPYSPPSASSKAMGAAQELVKRLSKVPKDKNRLDAAYEAIYEAARERNLVPKIAVAIFQAAVQPANISIVTYIAKRLSELKTNQTTLDELVEVFLNTLIGQSSGPAARPLQ